MTNPSLGRKKRRITYTASPQGVKTAEKALKRLGFESKSNFAKSQLLARSTVTKFFQSEPIQLNSLQRICEALKLNWTEIAEEIADIEEEPEPLEIDGGSSLDTNEGVEQVQTLCRQVTVIDKQSKTITVEIKLKGDINSVQSLEILTSILQTYSGETIKITDIKEGSIRLIVEGSQEDIERLVSRIKSGELTELSGFPVEDIQNLSESLDDKWRLVQEIASRAVEGRNLIGADLSDADLRRAGLRRADLKRADLSDADLSDAKLSDADLSGANLSFTNLSGADLSGANLSFANLSFANLSGADLSGADLNRTDLNRANLSSANLNGADLSSSNLSDANLSGFNLSGADLSSSNLSGARFGWDLGLSEDVKLNLKQRGANFDDSPSLKRQTPLRAEFIKDLVSNLQALAIVLEKRGYPASCYTTGGNMKSASFMTSLGDNHLIRFLVSEYGITWTEMRDDRELMKLEGAEAISQLQELANLIKLQGYFILDREANFQ